MNNTNAVILFVLMSLVCCLFTKNMIIILGLSVLLTNLLVVMNGTNTTSYKEGLENQEQDQEPSPKEKAIASVKANLKPIPNPQPAPAPTLEPTPAPVEPEPENTISNTENTEKKKGGKNRIDYASTLEEAYDNLDSILGGDGIKNLTNDTQKLMSKQQELFKSMESMAPMLNQAKSMLEGFDMKNLQGLASLATSFTATPDKKTEKK
jgi:outer membrane biosynthesis protein TonB